MVQQYLDSLPKELRLRIVELIAEGDEVQKLWREAVLARDDLKGEYKEIVENLDPGKGVWSMSLVSKEWREMCLSRLFKTVELFSTLKAIYDFRIHSRYSQYFTNVRILPRSSFETVDDALKALAHINRLPRIVTMEVEASSVPGLFGQSLLPPDLSDEAIALGWTAFLGIASNLKELSITSVRNSMEIDELIPLCVNLSTLKLIGNELALDGALTEGTRTSLKTLRHLRHLSIDTAADSAHSLDFGPLVEDIMSSPFRPSLSSLSISADTLHASWLPFATLFAGTLISLDLVSTTEEIDEIQNPPPFDFSNSTFPRLRHLGVTAFCIIAEKILLSTDRSRFPKIASLSFALNFYDAKDATPLQAPSRDVLKHARKLVKKRGTIRIYDKYWELPSSITDESEEFMIETTPTNPFPSEALITDVTGSKPLDIEDPLPWRNDLPEAVSLAVDYLVELRDRAEATDSMYDWIKLERLIREIEIDRVSMKS